MTHTFADLYMTIENDKLSFLEVSDLRRIFDRRDTTFRSHGDEAFNLWCVVNADTNTLCMPKYFPIHFDPMCDELYHDYYQRTVHKLAKMLHLMQATVDDVGTEDGDTAYESEWRIRFKSSSRECTEAVDIAFGAQEYECMEEMVIELIKLHQEEA